MIYSKSQVISLCVEYTAKTWFITKYKTSIYIITMYKSLVMMNNHISEKQCYIIFSEILCNYLFFLSSIFKGKIISFLLLPISNNISLITNSIFQIFLLLFYILFYFLFLYYLLIIVIYFLSSIYISFK